jgi:hypothetical protein
LEAYIILPTSEVYTVDRAFMAGVVYPIWLLTIT